MLTSICRSIVTICSALYLLIGMTSFSSKWILSHSTWYKNPRSRQVVPGHWDMTTMSVEMTGKALLFKSIVVQKRENRRDFHQVSDDLTLTQAAEILNGYIVVADNR